MTAIKHFPAVLGISETAFLERLNKAEGAENFRQRLEAVDNEVDLRLCVAEFNQMMRQVDALEKQKASVETTVPVDTDNAISEDKLDLDID